MDILAIVTNDSDSLFCMITWIGKKRNNSPLTRMWTSDDNSNTCSGDTIGGMETEIDYLTSRNGWKLLFKKEEE